MEEDKHIAELFDKYCSRHDCNTCKYNEDVRVVIDEMSCNEAYRNDYYKRYSNNK